MPSTATRPTRGAPSAYAACAEVNDLLQQALQAVLEFAVASDLARKLGEERLAVDHSFQAIGKELKNGIEAGSRVKAEHPQWSKKAAGQVPV